MFHVKHRDEVFNLSGLAILFAILCIIGSKLPEDKKRDMIIRNIVIVIGIIIAVYCIYLIGVIILNY